MTNETDCLANRVVADEPTPAQRIADRKAYDDAKRQRTERVIVLVFPGRQATDRK